MLGLRLGLSLRFGVGSRIRVGCRVGVGIGIWSRIGSGIGIGRCGARGRGWGRGRGRGWGNIAPSLVPLHVPHSSDGLDLRCSGSPVVPVLEFSLLKHILAPSVAWIHISHPPSEGRERVVYSISGT